MNLKEILTLEQLEALHTIYKFIEENDLSHISITYLGGVKLFTETDEEFISPMYQDMKRIAG